MTKILRINDIYYIQKQCHTVLNGCPEKILPGNFILKS